MSWAAEDWTAGLSSRALQKVQELQAHNEKLNRERQQRQLQLDNSDAALHKQKQKYETARAELAAVQRELVGVREEARGEARAKERMALELQAKLAQVCALEGQLDSARALAQNLAQEVKRLEAELEKLQKGSVSGESMLFSTPCWNMNSPWDQSGGKNGTGREGDAKAHPIRQQLVFGESSKPSVGGVSAEFAQQLHKTPPLRRRVYQSEASPFSVFPWERDDTRSTPRGRQVSTPSSSISTNDVLILDNDSQDNGTEEALRKEKDEACARVSGLQRELQLEKERCREAETRLTQTQRELSTKEQNLTRSTDELARAHTRITQEGDRTQAAEQRVKQLQEELKCQRQNAETSRCNAEQRRRDMEREHQRELQELQRERQTLEKQHQQESNRLNQEIQQARTLHNTLQAQYDKLALQKQAVERDLQGVQAKLKNAETDLTENQKRAAQTLVKLTESQKESEGLSISLEQLKKREKGLEADVKRLTEELSEALKLIKELQAQLAASPLQVSHPFTSVAVDNFTPVLSVHHDRVSPRKHSSQRSRALKAEGPREVDQPSTLTYPLDREPGEGIDSEHISVYGSENTLKLSMKEHAGSQHGAGSPGVVDMDSSITEQDTGIEDTDTESYMSDSNSEHVFKDESFLQKGIPHDSENENSSFLQQGKKKDSSLMELKKENAALHDELCDVKRELEQRLDDLENQRRAEAETRTKLKQLSKKHSTQAEQHRAKALELKEKSGKLEAQLDVERKESARLREVVATLEVKAEKRQADGERKEEEQQEEIAQLEEALAEIEKTVAEHEGERKRLEKKLEALQSELLQEREERAREMEEEEKKQLKNTEREALKIAELQAELDRLQSSVGVDKNVKDNMPLAYLQLGNESNPTNDVTEFKSFCKSVNIQNVLFSKGTETMTLITEDATQTKSSECSQQNIEDNTTAAERKGQAKGNEMMGLDNTTVLVLEVERLRTQRDREAERAKKAQRKLDTLQQQVTSQTQQLTLAFENQSKHIENLLRELQERDEDLKRQGEELQNCLEEIALLKSDKLKEVVPSVPLNTEQSLEVFEDPHCEIVISCATTTIEVVQEVGSPCVQDKALHSDLLQPCSNEEGRSDQPDNVSPTSDELHMSNVDTFVDTKVHMPLPTLDAHDKDSALFTESTMAKEPLEQLTTAHQGRHHTVHKNTEPPDCQGVPSSKEADGQYDPSDLQRLLEYPTDDISVLKRVINDLHEAQNELSLWKAKHEQLTLQLEEESREDLLSIKQENEQLKLKVLHKEKCLPQIPLLKQQEPSNLTSTQQGDVSSKGCAKHFASASSGLEAVDVDGSCGYALINGSEDTGKEHAGCENEVLFSSEVGSLQEQLQVLQAQHLLLSEQSRQQAEELQLWQLAALSPEEITGHHSNGHCIVLVREDKIILPCSSNPLHVQSRQCRSEVQQGDFSQQRACFSPGTGDNQTDYQLGSEKTTVHWQPMLNTKELIANGNSTKPADDNLKMEIGGKKVNTIFSSSTASSSETEITGGVSDLAHHVKQTGQREDAQQAVPVNRVDQLKENIVRTQSQDDVFATAETHTKYSSPKLNTEKSNTKHSQKPTINHDDALTSAQHCEALVRMTDYQNKHAVPPGRQTDKLSEREEQIAVMCLAVDQSQSSEVTNVTENPNQEKTKEAKSASTQTDVCPDMGEEALGGSSSPGCGPSIIHASTQTCAFEPKQTEEEEEQNSGAADSSLLSTASPLDTEKLLFSGAFPIPANPAHLAERIRRSRTRMSVAYDDTEYEPYGLPEVVMKGFADIPVGPACPYVLRRGLLGTDALPVSLREAQLKETEEEVDP